jgi:hypothetical protein
MPPFSFFYSYLAIKTYDHWDAMFVGICGGAMEGHGLAAEEMVEKRRGDAIITIEWRGGRNLSVSQTVWAGCTN